MIFGYLGDNHFLRANIVNFILIRKRSSWLFEMKFETVSTTLCFWNSAEEKWIPLLTKFIMVLLKVFKVKISSIR